ncbi:hypothetical protein [Amycolatopsis saalfeldensis]|uniref:Metal-dependent hydrolase, endonuclease/exonuclease/phosphatase family n=1 Tax=Amycolatopsis saalfeldensis TaxID=394193 RepID=A0A1H8YP76_9PSEU|nr:hypothetical protein [Amycolatopsis saalfeldensis]SEP53956.1 Metal-dependent hydrolase, endonuclease/exonuclease/phosphatase family [Amycolatopsis saalfeldensis]
MFQVMSVNLRHGAGDGRWAGIAALIRDVAPQILLLQEANGWADPEDQRLVAAEQELGMRGAIAPSPSGFHTGILIDGDAVSWDDWDTDHAHFSMHGHSELIATVPWLPAPLTVLSAHLSPDSADLAAQEAQVLIRHVHRTGGYGILGGDINHVPPGDAEPDWSKVPPHDRAARTVVADPVLRANHAVGHVLARGDLIDVAAHLADQRHDPTLRAWTGHIGMVRTDQIHITRKLLPALIDYRRIEARPFSDHDAVVAEFDPDKLPLPATADSAS